MTIEEKVKLRGKCNEILGYVTKLHQSLFPDLRYIQNFWALDIIDQDTDRFFEEPYDTIVRILPKIADLINNEIPDKTTTSIRALQIYIVDDLVKLNLAKTNGNLKLII